jgi:signal-transduction protein with cAMP-binding, CBS, and nucleotidyltransferase domain
MTVMTNKRVRHLPVVETGALIGIVSIGDVVKLKLAETELEVAAMRDYIGAA